MNTFGLLQDIITYSAGSLILGVLLTIVFEILLFVIIKGFFPKSAFSPLSIIVGIILAFFLGFRMISLCGAVSLKWMCDDFAVYISSLIPQELQMAALPVDEEFSNTLIEQALDEFPIFSSFVRYGTFYGQTTADIAYVMTDTLNSFLNQFILEAVLWCLLYIAIASIVVVWTMKKSWDSRVGQTRSLHNSSSSVSYKRPHNISHGHSRSQRLRR